LGADKSFLFWGFIAVMLLSFAMEFFGFNTR
jgi:hypothetical protein